ncbi:MAG: DUF2148 domain-containing protein [Peptococcaceae bacterium]|nr:DUF2148 domain-containing protein [Peptococcaceae bacterium]
MDDIMSTVANLMALAARTAPKAHGHDCIATKVITGDQLALLADEMIKYGRETGKINFDRDGENVRRSDAVLLIALHENKKVGLNCGACGHDSCSGVNEKEGREFPGPLCAWRIIDLGIAVGSAVKTASILNADNRVFYRAGVVARKLGLIDGLLVIGIPISAYSKNIYYDRPTS